MKKEILISLRGVSKAFDGETILDNVSLDIHDKEFVTLLGPSGCGKTTTLRIIGGFETADSGEVFFDGKEISQVPPYRRLVNTVFQKYALFPHLNVYENVAFGLRLKKTPEEEIKVKVQEMLTMVNLKGFERRRVTTLSGGQQQRVAIARALVNHPRVLLLDEPLGALDLKLRKDMQTELKKIQRQTGITFIYVTHDQEEALTMSDKIVIMRDGVIQQIASPEKIYDEPANAFVADFIGESTILSGTMIEDFKVEFCDTVFECVDKGFKRNEPIDVIIRPEDLKIKKPDDKKTILTAEVLSCVFKGDHYQVTVLAGGNEIIAHDTASYEVGETVGLYIKPFDLHIMRKARIINEIDTEMADEGLVYISGGQFECNSTLPAGTPVKVSVDFDDVEITDDEEDGVISATVVSSIYKGSYYQCIVRTDDHYDFFVDTDDDWLKGDRVGIKIAKDKIIVEEREAIDEEEVIEIPTVVVDEVDPELSEQLAEEIKTEVIEQAIEEELAVVYCGEVIETEDLEELKEEEQE